MMRRVRGNPIGVFDSGLGGLTVVKEILKQLPNERVVYFGDIARLPYGIKSKKQIIECSRDNAAFLAAKHVKALVVACNSSASVSLPVLRKTYGLPLIDVINPAVREALRLTQSHRIGVIGTQATIASGRYDKLIRGLSKETRVFSQACPLFVPLVEEGWAANGVAWKSIQKYLEPLRAKHIDVLILGCTHYPLLRAQIQKFLGPRVALVDSARPTVAVLKGLLERKGLVRTKPGRGKHLAVFVSDLPRNFIRIGQRFLGRQVHPVRIQLQ